MEQMMETERLLIEPLSMQDNEFIFQLLNSKGWIEFIGDRNILSLRDAELYIQKIIFNPNTDYWTVRLKENKAAIGIITLINRDYLQYRDIGFAFLPEYSGRGYAFEAASAVIKYVGEKFQMNTILAITVPENAASIQLLKKLGLQYERELVNNDELLNVYRMELKKPEEFQ
jgi:ribosomal-protein-alanine N-acetyltransferase